MGSNYGPPPDWARYRALGEAALRNILVDPDSARISWPNGYVQRGYTPWLHKRIYGYATCGLVNSRNRMGGYTGNIWFGVVIDYDQVLHVEIGDLDGQDFLSKACAKADFPPAAAMTPAHIAVLAPLPAVPPAGFGMTITDTPKGAFVLTVARGGAAERAGLTANSTITELNGIALRGMSEENIRSLLAATTGTASFTLDTGTVIAVARPAAATSPATTPSQPVAAAEARP